jgi:hypothetical protein
LTELIIHRNKQAINSLAALQQRLIKKGSSARWLNFSASGICLGTLPFQLLVKNLSNGDEVLIEDIPEAEIAWRRIRRDVLRAFSQHGNQTLALDW